GIDIGGRGFPGTGDPGRSYLPRDQLEFCAVYAVPVTRALEDSEITKTTVWRFASEIKNESLMSQAIQGERKPPSLRRPLLKRLLKPTLDIQNVPDELNLTSPRWLM
ncbi:hypothetical protein AB9F46_34910, partial [Rhizobium leguminosarum]|uniref:hypothetical protein n=1 Tax=Rhizobium leguminosarum TaxID=384 RepID=UPI003F9CEA2D